MKKEEILKDPDIKKLFSKKNLKVNAYEKAKITDMLDWLMSEYGFDTLQYTVRCVESRTIWEILL